MRRFLIAFAMLLALFTSPFAVASRANLFEFDAIIVPAGRSDADVAQAILEALNTRAWQVDADQPGRITASFTMRKLVARIAVETSAGQIQVRYLDSVNMKFEQTADRREIDSAYNEWVAQLHGEIARNIALEGAPEVAQGVPVVGNQVAQNAGKPTPTQSIAQFGRLELLEASMGLPYAGQPANDDALRNIQHALTTKLGAIVEQWNATVAPNGRVLRIVPEVKHIRFIGTAARLFAGRLLGKSSVTLSVSYVDAATGAVIAKPEFTLIADAVNGFSASARDYKMLENVGAAAANYTRISFDQAMAAGSATPSSGKSP